MNKFWLYLKKSFVTFVLILSIVSLATFPGCFFDDGDDDDNGSTDEVNVRDLIYGVRLTYQRQSVDKDKNYISVADEDFIKDLITQYLNISVEVLVSFASHYGKGVTDFEAVKNNIPTDFGEVTINSIRYEDSLSSSDDNYCKISDSATRWAWGSVLQNSSSASENKYASDFCSKDNLYKMMVALFLINMGKDCSQNGYGAYSEYFSQSPSKDRIDTLANNYKVTHSGLIDMERELFIQFILNNVIGAMSKEEYEEDITEMINEIFAQTDGAGLNGETGYKYPVVASVIVKDYTVKDISVESDDNDDADSNSEEDDEDEMEGNEFFTLKLGQQYYKSLVFMPKTEFKLNGLTLLFESTEDVDLTIYLRLHEADTEEMFFNDKVAELHICPGPYDSFEDTENEAEFELDLNQILLEFLGEDENRVDETLYGFGEYNQDTDVECFEEEKGRALAISNKGEDVTLASLYKISKESEESVGIVNFMKVDSWYLELVFETVGNKPFNIGFEDFDYDE